MTASSAVSVTRLIGSGSRPSQEVPRSAPSGAEESTATRESSGTSRSGPTIAELPTKERSPTVEGPTWIQPKPVRAELTIEWSAMKEPDSKVVRCGRVSTVEISTWLPTRAPSSRRKNGVAMEA